MCIFYLVWALQTDSFYNVDKTTNFFEKENDWSFTLYCFVRPLVGFQVKVGSKVDEAQFTGRSFE